MMNCCPATPLLIDCRREEDFIKGHHRQACHIDANDLFKRMHELPQKASPVALIGCVESLKTATAFLKDKAYQISNTTIYDRDHRQQLITQGLWQTGPSSIRLWQASPMIEHFCELLSKHPAANIKSIGLDIACGSGRDMVYLALQGWQMHGIDYQSEALQRTTRLAQNNQVAVQAYQHDLESDTNALQNLTQQGLPAAFDLITVWRYLHRPLLTTLQARLKPGGYLIYQTFMQGCEKISSPKNPNYLLAKNELANTFSQLNIIKNDIHHLQDGRPVSAFIAQRPH